MWSKIVNKTTKPEALGIALPGILETVNNLDFEFMTEDVDIIISDADNEGRNDTSLMTFDILVENNNGYFGFSV